MSLSPWPSQMWSFPPKLLTIRKFSCLVPMYRKPLKFGAAFSHVLASSNGSTIRTLGSAATRSRTPSEKWSWPAMIVYR